MTASMDAEARTLDLATDCNRCSKVSGPVEDAGISGLGYSSGSGVVVGIVATAERSDAQRLA